MFGFWSQKETIKATDYPFMPDMEIRFRMSLPRNPAYEFFNWLTQFDDFAAGLAGN